MMLLTRYGAGHHVWCPSQSVIPFTIYGAFLPSMGPSTKYGAYHQVWCQVCVFSQVWGLSPIVVPFTKHGAFHQVWCLSQIVMPFHQVWSPSPGVRPFTKHGAFHQVWWAPTNYGAFTKYGSFHHLWCLSPSMVHFPKWGVLHQVWCFFTMYGDLLLKMKILTTIDLHACMWPGPSSDVSIRTVTQRFLSSGRSERKQRFPHSAQHGGEI